MLEQLKRDVPLHFPRAAGNTGPVAGLKEIAAAGEQIALDWLKRAGHVLVDRNWRSGRFAEIDLITRTPDNMFAFIEVKTRRSWRSEAGFADYGFNAIDWRKRRKILIAARAYIARKQLVEPSCQCDAVLVTYDDVKAMPESILIYNPQILYVPNAFDSV